jgi:hypothetical protein
VSGSGTLAVDIADSVLADVVVSPGSVINLTGYRAAGYDATFRFMDIQKNVAGGPFVVRPVLGVRRTPGLINNAATQAVLANKPVLALGGSPHFLAMSFGGDDSLVVAGSGAQTSPHWGIAAIRSNISGANKTFLSLGAGSSATPRIGQFSINASNRLQVVYGTDGAVFTTGVDTVAPPGGYFVADILSDGTTTAMSKDGALVTTISPNAGTTTCANRVVGGAFTNISSEAFNGDIAFCAMGFSAITAGEIAILRRAARVCAGLDLS